jgi:hypothetical protein
LKASLGFGTDGWFMEEHFMEHLAVCVCIGSKPTEAVWLNEIVIQAVIKYWRDKIFPDEIVVKAISRAGDVIHSEAYLLKEPFVVEWS